MPGYCSKALLRFRHKASKLLDQPHHDAIPVYRTQIQYIKEADKSALLDPADKTSVQQVKETFLYYVRAVDATMLLALSVISSDQAAPTENTTKKTFKFLDYVTTHQDAILAYSGSNMILNAHSNALYLCEPKVKIRAGGNFFLSTNAEDPRDNGAVLNIAKQMKNVMSLAAEADIGALF
jgi:hypothetical protein